MNNKIFGLMKFSKYSVALSLLVILAGLVVFIVKGFVLGIDFSGGTILTLDMGQTFTNAEAPALQDLVAGSIEGDYQVAASENNQAIIRFQANTDDEAAEMETRKKLMEEIEKTYPNVSVASQERVGATAGDEMRTNALISVAIACVLMMIYIWIRFEIAFSLAAIAAIVHDVLIMAAVMLFMQVQINSSFIAAMLTIIGFSMNDTIVLFDRIRENVKRYRDKPKEEIVEISFSEMLTRTINTSLTVFITITALYTVGVQSIKEFALPLLVGIISGAYSTILFASPLWIWIHKAMDNRRRRGGKGGKKPAKAGNKKLAKSRA